MFELTESEFANLRSQIATSSWGGTRYLPMAFTEHGILQLSNVLKSKRAISVSFKIIDVLIRLREMLTDTTELRLAIEKLINKTNNHDKNIELVFQYIDELNDKKEKMKEQIKPRKVVGYKTSVKK